jgi:CBS-domain-containing membrane protein
MMQKFEVTLLMAVLLATAFLPFAVVDFFINDTPLWAFWKIVGGTFGTILALIAALEYKLNKG